MFDILRRLKEKLLQEKKKEARYYKPFADPLYDSEKGIIQDLKEKTFLKAYEWLDVRFDLSTYLEKFRAFMSSMGRIMPVSHAQTYKSSGVWYWYPFYYLGGIAIVSFIITAITGLILGFYYVPSAKGDPPEAYQSMVFIMTEVPFGYTMRALHHWAAHLMIASVFLHMLKVYFTGAYREARELNWMLGVGLLGLTLFFGYSGYLLPWNQLAFWAGVIGINIFGALPLIGSQVASFIFGGLEMTGAALIRMYIFHVYLLPIVVMGLILLHLIIVWVQGGAEPH